MLFSLPILQKKSNHILDNEKDQVFGNENVLLSAKKLQKNNKIQNIASQTKTEIFMKIGLPNNLKL